MNLLLQSLLVVLILYMTIGSVEVVWGASMEPNFKSGERILVDKITKSFKDYQRGEVVGVSSAYGNIKTLYKENYRFAR
ncbi:MAG: hypothetical protein KatS3mg101_0256 [Patescibacteria group bacterium]|nr:MAG: hypothetical protein KatS3mg101_0256 [Patescibacteria group bacterium]